jgi:hypothetical protein
VQGELVAASYALASLNSAPSPTATTMPAGNSQVACSYRAGSSPFCTWRPASCAIVAITFLTWSGRARALPISESSRGPSRLRCPSRSGRIVADQQCLVGMPGPAPRQQDFTRFVRCAICFMAPSAWSGFQIRRCRCRGGHNGADCCWPVTSSAARSPWAIDHPGPIFIDHPTR